VEAFSESWVFDILFSIMMEWAVGPWSSFLGIRMAGIPVSLCIAAAFMAELLFVCTLGSLFKLSCALDAIRKWV